jgi:CheY-like chemotaxis protein
MAVHATASSFMSSSKIYPDISPFNSLTSSHNDIAGGAAISEPKNLKFLIVDDSAMNRKMINRLINNVRATILRNKGSSIVIPEFEIDEADDGTVAIKRIEEITATGSHFDCVFMDSVMPLMHGPDAVWIMRNDMHYTGKVIGVTGNALPEEVANFKAMGVDEVLVKPLSFKTFLATLRNHNVIGRDYFRQNED